MRLLRSRSRGAHKRTDAVVSMPTHIRRGLQISVVAAVGLAMVVSTSVFGADSAEPEILAEAEIVTDRQGHDIPGFHLFSFDGPQDSGQSVSATDEGAPELESSVLKVKPAPPPPPPPVSRSAQRVSIKVDRSMSYAHLSPILAEAEKYRGTPYGYAGKGPKTFDCSGFTSYVMRQLGVSIPSSSAGQRNIKGATEVSAKEAKPGDIMWWPRSKGRSGHVAFYAGNGLQLDASTYGKPVDYRSTTRANPRYFRVSHLIK